jgi:hypothetical protein
MAGSFLNAGATVTCGHGGRATSAAPSARVMIVGQPAVVLGTTYVIAGCALPRPPLANGPCVSGRFPAGSARVRSLGQPLGLSSSVGICAPTGAPLMVVGTQTRVSGA